MMVRFLSLTPGPHVALQDDHTVQMLTLQFTSSSEQGSRLQPAVSINPSGQGLPPCFGFSSTWRWRCICPPSQDLSHMSQGVHGLITQSTAIMQARISFRLPTQGLPSFKGSTAMVLYLSRWSWESQWLQSDQGESWQSLVLSSPHFSRLQGTSSSRLPWQGVPPPKGGVRMPRFLCLMPPLQSSEHSVHSAHSVNKQFTRAVIAS
mmetsp:Transcript_134631/g.319125  ORF Transcript_134631/g.319125 Transcript_134631/m.319125 type:complete len:206 (+) Transcript_134631:3128-3745(+)